MSEQAQRHFQPGSTRLSRTSKAELEEGGTLLLETEEDYLELSAEETRQLADFLQSASVYPQLEERLALLSAHLRRGEASPKKVTQAILFELMLSLVPGPRFARDDCRAHPGGPTRTGGKEKVIRASEYRSFALGLKNTEFFEVGARISTPSTTAIIVAHHVERTR